MACADVTILILTYNGLPLLRTCLASLKQYDNICVIDNGSSEDVASALELFPNARMIRLEKNLGFAGAYNAAMREVKTPYVALVSNDTIAFTNCIERLLLAVQEDDSVGIAAPLIRNCDGSVQDTGWLLDVFGFPIECVEPSESWDAFYASGCFFVMQTDTFRTVNGFSEHFGFFVEDVDLCWKVRLHGKKVRVIREAEIYHIGGATLNGASTEPERNVTSARRTFFRERNVPLAFIQNFSSTQLAWRLPLYFANSVLEAAGIALAGRPALALSYVKGWLGCLRLLPVALRARTAVQGERQVSDGEITPLFQLRNRKLELILRKGLPILKG